ncbi:pyridoxal phosphate-dependent class II aminotransferase [Pelobacter sp. M08fum]|uniref:Aminotransferase n=1 Tax=Pelovirga terrestris TaxID=2771352 RepID=A0A8J6QX47_9BACT|nr:aminotransferase class I/II-fold pyridoxal phosphate-dependent enzyme [Pelovirga terrestris]MBD1399837.1 pyridoxal phosphate-dependent class II aminotransferase [Pelovirga terrestris]
MIVHQQHHGGNIYRAAAILGCRPDAIRDYSSNVADSQPAVVKDLDLPRLLGRLPEPHSHTLRAALAAHYQIAPENICVSAGTSEAIERLCALFAGKRVTIFTPTYSDYQHFAHAAALDITSVVAPAPDYAFTLDDMCIDSELCFLCQPNNPTGTSVARTDLVALIARHPATLFVVDESYLPFHLEEESLSLTTQLSANLLVLRSFSKIHGLPGLRLGFTLSGNRELTAELEQRCSPWNVNCPAQELGLRLIDIDNRPMAQRIAAQRRQLLSELDSFPWLQTLPSTVNFILCRLQGRRAAELFEHCLARRVLIRDCGNFEGLVGEHIRFSIKNDMTPLLTAFRELA